MHGCSTVMGTKVLLTVLSIWAWRSTRCMKRAYPVVSAGWQRTNKISSCEGVGWSQIPRSRLFTGHAQKRGNSLGRPVGTPTKLSWGKLETLRNANHHDFDKHVPRAGDRLKTKFKVKTHTRWRISAVSKGEKGFCCRVTYFSCPPAPKCISNVG